MVANSNWYNQEGHKAAKLGCKTIKVSLEVHSKKGYALFCEMHYVEIQTFNLFAILCCALYEFSGQSVPTIFQQSGNAFKDFKLTS